MPKIVFWTLCYLALGLRSEVMGQGKRSRSQVEVKGQGELSGAQRSILGTRLCRVEQRVIITGLEQRRVITIPRCLCVCVCNQWAYTDNCADAVDRPFNAFMHFYLNELEGVPIQLNLQTKCKICISKQQKNWHTH